MNVDKYGLPVQADGDANDQLQRVGMILVGGILRPDLEMMPIEDTCFYALNDKEKLQPKPGVYVRYVGGDPANVSADQLISALAAHVATENPKQVWRMFYRMLLRLGFAQNYKDGLSGSTKTKLPDFLLLRALPLIPRGLLPRALAYPLACACDVLLVLAACSAVGPVWKDNVLLPSKRGPDDVDDGNTILTLAICAARVPTPLSWLARKIYAKLRPWNYGCHDETWEDHHPVYGALRWYHRAESGGNPEIAELWKPICERYFT